MASHNQQHLPPHHFSDSDQPSCLTHALLHTNSSHHSNTNNNSSDVPNNIDANNFLNLHATAASHRRILRPDHSRVLDDVAAGGSLVDGATLSHESANLNMTAGDNPNAKSEVVVEDGEERLVKWENARSKAEILAHPLYEQLLSAHVACLRIATPVDQLPRIDAQLAQSENVVAKYSTLEHGAQTMVGDEKGLDQFMVSSKIVSRSFDKNSTSFKEQSVWYKLEPKENTLTFWVSYCCNYKDL